MLTWLRVRKWSGRTAAELYGSIVTAARREAFYLDFGVPDTPDGRFAMVVTHTYLILERLRQEGQAGQELSRAVVEAFVTDMDDCMREMGVGDLTVPQKVKKAAGALYDCTTAFRKAAAEGHSALASAVHSNLLPFEASTVAEGIAEYMQRAAAELEAHPSNELLAGRIAFARI